MSSIDKKLLIAVINIDYKVDKTIEKVDNTIEKVDGKSTPFKDTRISILGDDISTFEGWHPDTDTPVSYKPEDIVYHARFTWWYKLLTKLGAKLHVNHSISGNMITDGISIDNLIRKEGQVYINLDESKEPSDRDEKPEVIIIFLGMNDWKNSKKVSSTMSMEYKGSIDDYDMTDFQQAYEALLFKIFSTYYSSTVFLCTLPLSVNNDMRTFLNPNSGGYYLKQYNDVIRFIASKWQLPIIEFDKLSINSWLDRFYLAGTESISTLPTMTGMDTLAGRAYEDMVTNWSSPEIISMGQSGF